MPASISSSGTTPGERYLAQLCRTSFLSLWNHSNPFSDDGKDFSKPTSVGKELCDQLVVFGSHVLIFSDKEVRYTDHPNAEVNWARYYKAAIWKSAGQLWQAEKWLRQHPTRLYQDAQCSVPLQAVLPPADQMQVHRILVVHGVRDASRRALGGYGSFALDTQLVGEAHVRAAGGPIRPFVLGQVNPTKGFVHLFDDVSLPAVLSMLDTISDFVEYLEKKEQFLAGAGHRVYATSEVELLADYLLNQDATGRHQFPTLRPRAVAEFLAGGYQDWLRSREWASRQAADRVSYLWDGLIEYVTEHYVRDTMQFSSDKSLVANEQALRFLAQEQRLSRRHLAQTLNELLHNTPHGKYRATTLRSDQQPGLIYALLTVPPSPSTVEDEQYRKRRRLFLESYCRVVKLHFYGEVIDIVGIATEAGGIQSVDLLHYDCRGEWEEGEKELAETIQQRTNFILKSKVRDVYVDEYPD